MTKDQQATGQEQQEDSDDDEELPVITLKAAREAFENCKLFMQQNEGLYDEADLDFLSKMREKLIVHSRKCLSVKMMSDFFPLK